MPEQIQILHMQALENHPNDIKLFSKTECLLKESRSLYLIISSPSISSKVLGAGGFGKVKMHIGFNGEVFAVKTVNLRTVFSIECYTAEVEILKELGRHIADKIRKTPKKSKGLIAMPYYVGRTVEKLTKEFTPTMMVTLFKSMTAELKLVHDLGWLHNDLKPENFIFEYDKPEGSQIKLIDFGSARRLGKRGETTSYCSAPETLGGEKMTERTLATDIYGLGSVFSFVRTVCHPANNCSYSEIDQMISRMRAKDPTQRPTLDEVFNNLDQIVAEVSGGPKNK